MGLRDLARMIDEARQQVTVGVLAAALALVGGSTACSTDTGATTPQPDTLVVADGGGQKADAGPSSTDVAGDVAIPFDAPPVMLYGPQPVDAGGTDTVADTVVVKPDSGPVTYYGPRPFDAGSVDSGTVDTGNVDAKSDSGPKMLYGPLPVDAGPDEMKDAGCDPVAIYGPKPCQDDAECEAQTPGWYCDKGNTFADGCGGTMTWPVCKAP